MNGENMTNPLKSHMRNNKLHVKLPSQGFFYDEADVDFTATTNEIGVKSMTAADELALSTPDSLLNGDAISSVIRSCCESIKNPMVLTVSDVDVLMVAIKIASYGEYIDATINCPSCDEEMNYKISLTGMITNLKYSVEEYPLALDKDLTVFLKPNTFTSIIKQGLKAIEAANIIRQFDQDDKEDLDKAIKYTQEFKKMAALNVDILLDGISHIAVFNTETSEMDTVSNYDDIEEWLNDINKEQVDKIKEKLFEINGVGLDKLKDFACSECKHEWSDNVDMNPVTFFMDGF